MCKCIYDVFQYVGKEKEMRNVKREVILLSVFLTGVIYMTNWSCKEWCCDCELKWKSMGFEGRVVVYFLLIELIAMRVLEG